MAYNEITSEEVASGEPLDELLLTKIKGNFDYLKSNEASGIGAIWLDDVANSAVMDTEYEQRVAKFQYGLQQKLATVIKVPTGFDVGNIPKLKIGVYSPSNIGGRTIKFQATVKLIRSNEAVNDGSAKTQTFNTEIASTTTVNDHQEIILNLSDLSGQIDGENVDGDQIMYIVIERASDTDTETVRFILNLTEVTFK